MKLIEREEQKRFDTLLKNRSMSPADFELHEVDLTDPKSDELLPLQGYVEVHRKSTDKTREYPIGDGMSWVRGFQNDLKNHYFG
ncbi:MAG: transcriptional regulator [Burkholderiales bacterium]|nr:transcriptional regulator [Burkholderiales bacterium]